MKKAMVALALALAGCAGTRSVDAKDPLPGQWVGVIDRDGWQRPLSVMIDRSEGSYKGSWMSLESQPGVMLDGVRRSAEDVHLELAALVFDGRIAGRSLAGTVANKAGASVGSFTLTRVDPTPFRDASGP